MMTRRRRKRKTGKIKKTEKGQRDGDKDDAEDKNVNKEIMVNETNDNKTQRQ